MQTLRNRAVDRGRARGRELERRIGRELRLARVSHGYSQEEVARRAGVSQSTVSKVELGEARASVDVLARTAAACDHELAIKLFPAAASRLRDTPQLSLAEPIIREAHPVWHASTEVAAGDGRAADLVLEHPVEVLHAEIESGIVDFQAQFRPAQAKRQVLADRFDRPVRLIIVVPDSHVVRRRLEGHADFIRRMLPASSREVWRAIRSGTPLGRDGILFVRRSPARRPRP